jgi:hypothetical protein
VDLDRGRRLMSRFGEIHLDWGGEPDRAFRLGIGQIGKLQEKVDAGPLTIAAMCQVTLAAQHFTGEGNWIALSRLDLKQMAEMPHVREVHLQGLLGANVPGPVALALVKEWVEERPLSENLVSAIKICQAHAIGVEDERAMGEPQAAEEASPTSRAANTVSGKTASTQ